MKKIILLTGATDGIGFETSKILASQGHTLLLHGRSEDKLTKTKEALTQVNSTASISTYRADLSNLKDVVTMAASVKQEHDTIDVLINNAGVYVTPEPITSTGYDVRFMVNTIAPYVLSLRLLPLMNSQSRIINLSSAAQAPVNLDALKGHYTLSDGEAYAQSKLAITQWSFELAKKLDHNAPAFIAINPASFLGSKMVKEAYGSEGKDLSIGAERLVEAALSDTFANRSGEYFDNDIGSWSQPHTDALNESKRNALITVMDEIVEQLIPSS